MQKIILQTISLFIAFTLFNSCKKNTETVSPSQVKTVLSDKTLILNEATQSAILEVKDDVIIFKTLPALPNGRSSAETAIGVGNNLIIEPNAKYPDGVACYIKAITKNADGTFTANTTYPKIPEVFKSLNEKVTTPINNTTISKIYKPNGEILPYTIGSLGVNVPISISYPIKSEPGLNAPSIKLGEIKLEGNFEFSGKTEYACIMDGVSLNFWASRTEIQDKEKLTATFSTDWKKRKLSINQNKVVKLDNIDFKGKPFDITVPIFETKLKPVIMGTGLWITPSIKVYMKVVGDIEGEISVTIFERDGGTTIKYDEYTDTEGWKTDIEKITGGGTKTLTDLELSLMGSLALTPTLELNGSPWGLSKISSVGTTLGLESKLKMGVELSPQVGNTSFDFILTGKGAVKLGAKIKLNALWAKIVDFEPQIKLGAEWDIFKPIKWNILADNTDPVTTIPVDGLVAYYPFNGNANDESGNKNNGIVNGVTLTSDKSNKANSASSFNGSSFIEIKNSTSIDITKSLTLSAWVQINGNPQEMRLIDKAPVNTNNGYLIDLGAGTNNKKIRFIGASANYASLSDFTQTSWTHIAVTFTGSKVNFYINGKIDTSVNSTSNTLSSVTNSLFLGKSQNQSTCNCNYFKGNLDEVRIYNRALSESEIQTLAK